MANNTYSFGSSTYTYLWTLPIEDAVTSLIAQGFGELEVMASGRHLEQLTVPRVQKVISQNVVGLNPPGLDLNLVSVEEEWRRASVNHYESIIDVAGALDATYVVVVPGRAHPLSPAPKEFLEDSLRTALDRLARR